MPLWRLILALEGPLGTPLGSGTLFGHLCWAMVRREGESVLAGWLDHLAAGSALCRISDAMPKDLLPRPLLRPGPVDEGLDTAAADALKQRRKWRWLRREGWLAARQALTPDTLDPFLTSIATSTVEHAHNRIDRYTGTTPKEGGGLWFVDDDWSFAKAPLRDLYVETDLAPDYLQDLVADVGAEGYGRDATYGRGRFTVRSLEPDEALLTHGGNRWMSLSHGCLDRAMVEPRYERFTHFGKVGATMAARTGRPFKRPVLLMRPGATFGGTGPFGRLLDGVHQDEPKVRHDAQHLAIPFTEAA